MSPQWEQLAALARRKQRELTHGFATSWGGLAIAELGFAIALEEARLLV